MIEKNEVNWWSASCGPHQSNSPNQLKKVNFLYWLVNWLELPPPTIALLIDSLNSSIKCRNGQHSCGGWVCLHSTNLLFIQHKSKKFDFVDEEKNVEWFVEFEFDLSLFSLSSRSVWPLCRPITHRSSKKEKTNSISLLGRKGRSKPTFLFQLIRKSWKERKVWFCWWPAAINFIYSFQQMLSLLIHLISLSFHQIHQLFQQLS